MHAIAHDFMGATGRFVFEDKPYFFRSIKSVKDAAIRTASIITAPVLFTGLSAFCLVYVAHELLGAIINILNDASESVENFENCLIACYSTVRFLIAAFLSPLVNIIDLAGSIFVKEAIEDELDTSWIPQV